MQKTSIIRAGLYGLCGLAAYGVDQAMNYEFMVSLEGGITSLVIAVPVAGILCSVSWASVSRCLLKGDLPNAVLLLGVFASLAAFSLGASVYRAGEAYDAKLAATKSANMPIAIAERTVREAKTDWLAKDNAVQRELARGGCGRICRARKESAEHARRLYDVAKMKLAKLGAPRTADPMAARLASVFTIPQELIGVFYPLTLPVGIWLASVVFIGLAVNEICGRQIGRRLPFSKLKVNVSADADLPLGLRIRKWMDTQERLDGRRPTQREAAQHFEVSPSTVSRHLSKYGSTKSVGAVASSKADERRARIAYECA